MLSSAARFGDTTHLDLYGKNGYEVPDWSEGKDVPADIGRLAMAESEYVKHGFPEIDSLQISPDFATISRYDGTTTTNFGDDPKRAFASLLTGRRDPSLTGIGEATLLRALITHLSTTGQTFDAGFINRSLLENNREDLSGGYSGREGTTESLSGRGSSGAEGGLVGPVKPGSPEID